MSLTTTPSHIASDELIADIARAMRPPSGPSPFQPAGVDVPVDPSSRADAAPREHVDKGSLAELSSVAELLRKRPSLVRDRLAFLTRDDAALAELANSSYQHQNGFVKIRLFTTAGCSVRLHIWPPSDRFRGECNPHGHRWEFASWIMTGEGMVERMYAPCGAGDPGAGGHHLYDYGGSGSVGTFSPRGRAWLREERQCVREAGSVYACPREVVHTVEPIGNGLLATVVAQGPVVRRRAPVYAMFNGDPRSRERTITGHEITTYLAAIDTLPVNIG